MAPQPTEDERVILNGMTWQDYERLLADRGDQAGARMAFLDGTIELMRSSFHHEGVKKTLCRLVEAYADERGLDLNGYGSWTLKNALVGRGLEPDACYALGVPGGDLPQLAIEVVWTSGGLNKLDIYRSLGVGEVWIWERGAGFSVHVLRDGRYEKATRSALLPELDLALLQSFVESPNQSQAVRAFREALRGSTGG
ncbi:Uma2 family endonuclease [Polyangium jinanense]|uniref:Uma2 family endonuclease n=1 Tax=Polyangium jinanense TaxID=2829994 RepID=A0A9X3X1J3_9BACT|nr:Uma2 family endonuclease [Polyangium jinanense]MDC3956298.1 Uma2 family endonuclease [Polyangium jinanense]MDC3982434.1 Uma2 family endonuclease [Polyangium jinanense]